MEGLEDTEREYPVDAMLSARCCQMRHAEALAEWNRILVVRTGAFLPTYAASDEKLIGGGAINKHGNTSGK